jgi:hypothetical protein
MKSTEYKGETGMAYRRSQEFGSIRVRMVEQCDSCDGRWTLAEISA